MPEQFLHGVEVIEVSSGPRPIQTVASSVIGIVGTAPNSQPLTAATLAVGTVGSNNALTFTAAAAGSLGNNISIRFVDPNGASQPIRVEVAQNVVTVYLATDSGSTIATTATQIVTAIAGNTAAAALVSAANKDTSDGSGVVSAFPQTFLSGGTDEAFPLNTPVVIAGSQLQASLLGTTGTLPNAIDGIFDQAGAVLVVVRVAQQNNSDTDAGTITNVIGGASGSTYTGVHAFVSAEPITGLVPRVLIAPGFSTKEVISEMIGIATKLRAVIIADGPNDNTDAAASGFAAIFGSDRVYVVDPQVQVVRDSLTVSEPASPRVAGLIALSDNTRGFWWSPSNQTINGIVGTTRPVDFTFGDPTCRANLLNAANVATIIRQNGFRLWGNRTTSTDPKFAFLSVRRTADMINDSILRAHLWAVDRNINRTYLEDVAESVNAYLRTLEAEGAILGGRCYPDPDLNTPANIAAGKVYFDFEFTPPYPAEHITFQSMIVNDYLVDLTTNTSN